MLLQSAAGAWHIVESRAIALGVPGAMVPGGLLHLDGVTFLALLEAIFREGGNDETLDDLYTPKGIAPTRKAAPESPEERGARIQSLMDRFGG